MSPAPFWGLASRILDTTPVLAASSFRNVDGVGKRSALYITAPATMLEAY